MIIDRLVLHNFSVYKGRQILEITPPDHNKPITLIGGLNGNGKTTLLDAMQLVLFGKLARCSNRGGLSYNEYLNRSINRGVRKSEGAGIELHFRKTIEGAEHAFSIHRSWSSNGNGMRERFEVLNDHKIDVAMSESWNEYIDSFIPEKVSNLFFFDGERIEGLADLENSTELLATAVNALLGVNLIDKLEADLLTLEKRNKLSDSNNEDRLKIEALESAINSLNDQKESYLTEKAGLKNKHERIQKQYEGLNTDYQKQGGLVFEQREQLELQESEAKNQLQVLNEDLIEVASGHLPLLLILKDIQSLISNDKLEQSSKSAGEVLEVLTERDDSIIKKLISLNVSDNVLDDISQYFNKDREARLGQVGHLPYLNLSNDSRNLLHSLQSRLLDDARKNARVLCDKVQEIENELSIISRKLDSVPSETKIAQILKDRDQLLFESHKIEGQISLLQERIEKTNQELEANKLKLVSLLEANVHLEVKNSDKDRVIAHCAKARNTLNTFRSKILENNINKIEQLIFESFVHLLRKQSLVTSLRIDPSSYAVELRSGTGELLPPERLSAGEKQLLAVSMLWGLARATGRPLPVVIDTPLGRLDTDHRMHLVTRYFPYASHQVLLLSTDEEIDKNYEEKIKPWVGHRYRLQFDEKEDATTITPGYFWG